MSWLRKPGWSFLAFVGVAGIILLAVAFSVRATLIDRDADKIEQIAIEGRQAHDALCVLKDDIRRRIVNSQEFLDENPNGIPGISPIVIKQSIRDRQRTFNALKNLKCE